MEALRERGKRFLKSEDGPTAAEYAVMLALIIIVALTAIALVGHKLSDTFINSQAALPQSVHIS